MKNDKEEKEEEAKSNFNFIKNEQQTKIIINENKRENGKKKLKNIPKPSPKPKKQIMINPPIISKTKQMYKANSNRRKNKKNIRQSRPIEIIEEEKYESSSDDIESYLMSPGHSISDSNSSYKNASSSSEQTESESEDSISQYLI